MVIEDFVDRWGQSIVGNLKNGGMPAAEHVVRIFEVKLKNWLMNRF